MEIIIDTNKKFKICPVCHRLYDVEDNFCSSHEEQKIELVKVKFQ